jgi:hypothetical protein
VDAPHGALAPSASSSLFSPPTGMSALVYLMVPWQFLLQGIPPPGWPGITHHFTTDERFHGVRYLVTSARSDSWVLGIVALLICVKEVNTKEVGDRLIYYN